MKQCDSCGRKSAEPFVKTVTGRRICQSCNDRLLGMAAGSMAAGSGAGTSKQIESAVIFEEFFKRIKRARGSK